MGKGFPNNGGESSNEEEVGEEEKEKGKVKKRGREGRRKFTFQDNWFFL